MVKIEASTYTALICYDNPRAMISVSLSDTTPDSYKLLSKSLNGSRHAFNVVALHSFLSFRFDWSSAY